MKMVFLIILSVIVIIGLTMGALELFSSYKTSTSINKEAPVQTTQKMAINASPEKIWKIMSEIDQWKNWHKDVQNPKLKGTFQAGSSFNWKSGGLNIHSTIHTATPYTKIGWSGKAFGAFAIHNWTFTQMQGYTEVSVEESMEGWLVKLTRKKFQSGLEQSLIIWLTNLKTEAEK
ncbi:MAG TPA: SRPBCC family protein [Chitinophagaceae bacterium]|nr:SRPBCC family protein [Chitinophagaceae bacterium]